MLPVPSLSFCRWSALARQNRPCFVRGGFRPLSTTDAKLNASAGSKRAPASGTGTGGSLYKALGLSEDATQTEIREAYYRKAKELHPDVNPSPEAKEQFARAQEAFAKLKNPRRRSEYDEETGRKKSVEQMAEDMDVYLTTRKKLGPKKIWSEKLEADLILASRMRIARRKNSRPEMKPYMRYDPSRVRGEYKHDYNADVEDLKEQQVGYDIKRPHTIGPLPETPELFKRLSVIVIGTAIVVLGYYQTEPAVQQVPRSEPE